MKKAGAVAIPDKSKKTTPKFPDERKIKISIKNYRYENKK